MALVRTFRFGRLIWTLFVTWYFINFSRNFFSTLVPERMQIPSAFFIILVLWMAFEYYFGSPALQSGIVSHLPIVKNLFTFFFYANAIYCIWDFSSLNLTQLNFLYPYLNIIGIIIFTIGVLLRYFTLIELLRLPANKLPKSGVFQTCRHPRSLATIIQIISIPLVFTSYLGLILALTLGLFLIYKLMQSEEKSLIKQYKEEYINYQNNVPFIIPKLSRFALVKSEPKQKVKKSR